MNGDGAIQTVSGRRFDPLAPEISEIDVVDIAHALANQCRFGGHARVFYSVAQHSCVLADVVAARGGDSRATLSALLHDASEAYLLDLPHPLKHRTELGELYRRIEAPLQRAICQRFGIPAEPPPFLKEIDRALLATERRAFLTEAWEWPELTGTTPLDVELDAWPPERAEHEFLRRYAELAR